MNTRSQGKVGQVALPAFTLIELLVVITIIVVLLALLTPALDKAIYQAELVQCGAQLDGIATSATLYAMNYKRRYPARTIDNAETDDYTPQILKSFPLFAGDETGTADDRQVLDGFMNLKLMIDPFCDKVDLSVEASDPEAGVYSSYMLWYGWKYNNHAGLKKVGNRFSWTNYTPDGPVQFRFNYLATDADLIGDGDPGAAATHPDEDGVLSPLVYQSQAVTGAFADTTTAAVSNAVKLTISAWWSVTDFQRGLMDSQAAGEDGSVQRVIDVEWDETEDQGRIVRVPVTKGGGISPEHLKIIRQ